MRTAIEVNDISVRFRMASDRVNTLKEFMIRTLSKK